MPPFEYRAYVIGAGRILQRIDLICDDDAAARERAQQLVEDHPVELWRGDKLLDRFEPKQ